MRACVRAGVRACSSTVDTPTWMVRSAVPTTSKSSTTSMAYTRSGSGCVCTGLAVRRSQYLRVLSHDPVTSMEWRGM